MASIPIVFLLSRKHAELYDKVFDSFDQNEVAFAHACLRSLTDFIESDGSPQKEEIAAAIEAFDEAQNEEKSTGEPLAREIILDKETHTWFERITEHINKKSSHGDQSIPDSVLCGMVLIDIMQRILERNPTASLRVHSLTRPLAQILNFKPQFLN